MSASPPEDLQRIDGSARALRTASAPARIMPLNFPGERGKCDGTLILRRINAARPGMRAATTVLDRLQPFRQYYLPRYCTGSATSIKRPWGDLSMRGRCGSSLEVINTFRRHSAVSGWITRDDWHAPASTPVCWSPTAMRARSTSGRRLPPRAAVPRLPTCLGNMADRDCLPSEIAAPTAPRTVTTPAPTATANEPAMPTSLHQLSAEPRPDT